MQTLKEAIKQANRIAHKGNYPETTFVVFSRDEEDIIGNNYHVCWEYDLDTFYQGCEVLYCSDEYGYF